MQVKKQQLEPDREQQTGFKMRKQYVKALYCHTAYLTYMQSTSDEISGWMKHKLESSLPEATLLFLDPKGLLHNFCVLILPYIPE